MEAKPFYPLVSVVRNGTTSVKKLKAWQFPDTGDVTWQLLDIIIILCSTIDVGAKTFRITHALKKIPVWKPLLQRLGQETSDHHFPSLQSFAQRKNTDAVTEKHRERASVSTYGLLLLALVETQTWSQNRPLAKLLGVAQRLRFDGAAGQNDQLALLAALKQSVGDEHARCTCPALNK